MAGHMRTIFDRLAVLPALTIAALNGHALGGGAEVAVACDLRVAAADVTMAFNQSQLSITPAWGGTERLTTLVGRSRALELLLTPRRLTSAEALHIGLVNEVVERDAFDARIDAIATSVARLPATVVLPLKQLVDRVSRPAAHDPRRRGGRLRNHVGQRRALERRGRDDVSKATSVIPDVWPLRSDAGPWTAGVNRSSPLEGLRVLDFSGLLPGPLATLLMAHAGATVVKVERPDGGDLLRQHPATSRCSTMGSAVWPQT